MTFKNMFVFLIFLISKDKLQSIDLNIENYIIFSEKHNGNYLFS